MEPQTRESPPPTETCTHRVRHAESETNNPQTPATDTELTTTPTPTEPISVSVPALRFPRPQGSQILANWVSNSAPDIRQPLGMSDAGSLADSAYEIITDTESQDDRLTESTCSLSVSRPDDVQSLDGSVDQYNSDSDEDSDQVSHASSIRYADQSLQNPSTQRSTGSLEHGSSSTEGSGVVIQSIQFREVQDEEDPVLPEVIYAQHPTWEFDEEESTYITRQLGLFDAPKYWNASIRQTMAQGYLTTDEPLRVLYVGRAEAQRSIVLKICNAIWASPYSKDRDHLSRHRDGVYNIVPISSFGPAPELDLMEASQYQIKVEHCTSAEEIVYEDGVLPGDATASLTIDQDKTYRSLSYPTGSVVEPKWNVPHIAIFYCSSEDDEEADGAKTAAWSFMQRHGVPCMFIADHQDFCNLNWGQYIDEDSIHLSLESADPNDLVVPQRFPIDFASFADIDAGQMNRNLAYLTGLGEIEETLGGVTRRIRDWADPSLTMELVQPFKAFKERLHKLEEVGLRVLSLLPMLLLLVAPFIALPLVNWMWSGSLSTLGPASAPSADVCVSSPSYPELTTSGIVTAATSTTTVVINVTSTQTVQVSQTQPSTSALASVLSFAGFLSDKPSAVPADIETKNKQPANANKMACAVHIYSPTEILVAIPSRNKAVWLAQGAIDIAVRRRDATIKTKISSVDEGILVELDRKDAYGVLNITVITTRRPKVNETFEIDFGRSAAGEVFEAGLNLVQGALKMVPFADDATSLLENARKLRQEIRKLPREVVSSLEQASEAVRTRTSDTVKQTAHNAREQLANQARSVEAIRKEIDLSVLQAQVASKLWWLRVQGKMEEYAAYQRNASQFLKAKHAELVNSRTSRRTSRKGASSKETKSPCGFKSMMYPLLKRNCGGSGQDRKEGVPSQQERWEGAWRKIVG
ncbi:uncharacterized protein C8A04DRAFT_14874 [Dichotomopilus funicola]|uniref:Uncharacterized protein n=1 Tax=Dichotomopilus funicola TaxID=1934379 RepID=A0AAN6UZ17_9PEZI|nr:hypothetical protein C8A04DRAFT_14874 [Dichotomopilus funicola]